MNSSYITKEASEDLLKKRVIVRNISTFICNFVFALYSHTEQIIKLIINLYRMNFLLAIVVSILTYGAVPNDTTVNNANAINTAISDCADKGG